MKIQAFVAVLICGFLQMACCIDTWKTSAPKVCAGDNWAQITWTKPASGDSVVEYGVTKNYDHLTSNSNENFSHRVSLFDLKPETKYHYRVRTRSLLTYWSDDHTFTTGPEVFGCESNPTGEPLGGGLGYSRIIKPKQATVIVKTTPEFLNALRSAKPGDIIYVDDQSVIDVSEYKNILIPGGITLASGRGRDGSVGGLIQYTKFETADSTPVLRTAGNGARITGLRFGGPSNALGRVGPMYRLLYAGSFTEIDNCEFWGWNYEAIETIRNSEDLYIHHNYFHHNTRLGCGYAVNASVGTALIEGNLFDFHRHSIASSGWAPSSYEARYNCVMEHSISHVFDMHGAVDSEVRTNVGVWRFDETSGTVTADSSTYGNNNPTMIGFENDCRVAGQVNTALEFNGKSYIDCGAGYKNNLSRPAFGIMGWIKPETVSGTQAIFSKATARDGYSLRLVDGALEAIVFDSTGAKKAQTAGVVVPDKWSHVALSFDGSVARIYLNGKEVGSFACDGVKHSAGHLTFGRDSATATSYFKGAMDEIRAYRAAMKAADVDRNYIGQGDIAGVVMRIHHNTSRVVDKGSVCVRGKPAVGCWIDHNRFYRDNDDWNIRQLNAAGNMFIEKNIFGPKQQEPTGAAPTLTWAGVDEFKAAGVSPRTGDGSQIFRFHVKYTDPDNDAPQPGYPRLILKRNGETFLYLTPLTMMPLNENKFSKGRTYMCEMNLPRGNDYTYAFEALDMAGNAATGEATNNTAGPQVTSGNAVPVLYPVMGHANFVENWIYPADGTVETEFDFRVTYLDTDNDAPQGGSPKVRITDANGGDIAGSPFAMTPITQTQYANGRNYQLLTKLPQGNFRCQILASDTQGASPVNVRPTQITVRAAGDKNISRTALTPFD